MSQARIQTKTFSFRLSTWNDRLAAYTQKPIQTGSSGTYAYAKIPSHVPRYVHPALYKRQCVLALGSFSDADALYTHASSTRSKISPVTLRWKILMKPRFAPCLPVSNAPKSTSLTIGSICKFVHVLNKISKLSLFWGHLGTDMEIEPNIIHLPADKKWFSEHVLYTTF